MAEKYEKLIFDLTELLKGENSDRCFCKRRITFIEERLNQAENETNLSKKGI